MHDILVIIVLGIVVLIIAWIGNGIADKTTDLFRNTNTRINNEMNPPKQENLSDRFR